MPDALRLTSPPTEPDTLGGTQRTGRSLAGRLVPPFIVLILAANEIAVRYYTSTMADRVRSPYHAGPRSSGIIGQIAGVPAFSLFIFLWLYPLRKRVRALFLLEPAPRTLDFYITGGIVIPLLAATHARWRFTGLIGLGYAAMFPVCFLERIGIRMVETDIAAEEAVQAAVA